MLLEALIAILLFSLGILALIGLQARSIGFAGQAKYRTDAALLSERLIGEMWSDRINIPSYAWAGTGTVPTKLANWASQVGVTLPGSSTKLPTVDISKVEYITTSPSYTAYTITITLYWRTPEEAGANLAHHKLATTAYIPCC